MARWVAMAADRGHRAVSHTADVILEAWAPDLAACLEEAVAALVGIYAVVADGERRRAHALRLPAGSAERQLLDLLDEVIFLLDTDDDVPVGATVHRLDETGGGEVDIWLAPREDVDPTGSVPKAISQSELAVTADAGQASCRFLVDV